MSHTKIDQPTDRREGRHQPRPHTRHGRRSGSVEDLPPPIEPLTIRPVQAARALNVSEAKIWQWIAAGDLQVSRIGNLTLVHVASMRALLARNLAK
jgi:hypothetical protein